MIIQEKIGVKTTFNQLNSGDVFCYGYGGFYYMLIRDTNEGNKVISLPEGYVQQTLDNPDREVIKLECELWLH